jgi:hypothetical protein
MSSKLLMALLSTIILGFRPHDPTVGIIFMGMCLQSHCLAMDIPLALLFRLSGIMSQYSFLLKPHTMAFKVNLIKCQVTAGDTPSFQLYIFWQ